MEIKIKDTSYPIYLGFDAINYLDNQYCVDMNGIKLGFGIVSVITQLRARNVLAIYNMIKAGTNTLQQQPSSQDIEDYFGELTEKQFDDLCEEFINELKKQPLTRVTALKITKEAKKKEEA